MNPHYFGTDGIRGQFGSHPITATFATQLAVALSRYLSIKNTAPAEGLQVVLARDTRHSGLELLQALKAGFEFKGVSVVDMGVAPTPQLAFATRHLGANLGIAVTASHNPVKHNGFKLFKADATKFDTDEEIEIERFLFDAAEDHLPPSIENQSENVVDWSCTSAGSSIRAAYFEHLNKVFARLRLDGLHIVVDCAHGATWESTPQFLRSLGAVVTEIASRPDGCNINVGVGSEHPEALCEQVIRLHADLGLAHDGDGDRVMIVDSQGKVLSGEHVLGIISQHSPSISCSHNRALVTTVMSNYALMHALTKRGVATLITDVGDRNVGIEMRRTGSLFGGENSGHFICMDALPTGDGLIAALKLLEAVLREGSALHQLVERMPLFPSRLLNLNVHSKPQLEELLHLQNATRLAQSKMNGSGRILLRYSGTENKLRILVECREPELLETTLYSLKNAAELDIAESSQ